MSPEEIPARYRTRPVQVEAMRLTEDSMDAVAAWVGGKAEARRLPGPGRGTHKGIVIRTLEGDIRARPGDWIVKDVKGKFRPVRPDAFEETYEPLD